MSKKLIEAFKEAGIPCKTYTFTEEDMKEWNKREEEFVEWMKEREEDKRKTEEWIKRNPIVFKGKQIIG